MATLEKAIAIAATAHEGQKDKAGTSYILHPIRLMLKMETEAERIVAVLHDVVEDSELTLDALRQYGFSETVVEAVDSVTSRAGETYEAFIDRARQNPIGRKVKIADLEDNMNLMRMHTLADKDIKRLRRYHRVWSQLSQGE